MIGNGPDRERLKAEIKETHKRLDAAVEGLRNAVYNNAGRNLYNNERAPDDIFNKYYAAPHMEVEQIEALLGRVDSEPDLEKLYADLKQREKNVREQMIILADRLRNETKNREAIKAINEIINKEEALKNQEKEDNTTKSQQENQEKVRQDFVVEQERLLVQEKLIERERNLQIGDKESINDETSRIEEQLKKLDDEEKTANIALRKAQEDLGATEIELENAQKNMNEVLSYIDETVKNIEEETEKLNKINTRKTEQTSKVNSATADLTKLENDRIECKKNQDMLLDNLSKLQPIVLGENPTEEEIKRKDEIENSQKELNTQIEKSKNDIVNFENAIVKQKEILGTEQDKLNILLKNEASINRVIQEEKGILSGLQLQKNSLLNKQETLKSKATSLEQTIQTKTEHLKSIDSKKFELTSKKEKLAKLSALIDLEKEGLENEKATGTRVNDLRVDIDSMETRMQELGTVSESLRNEVTTLGKENTTLVEANNAATVKITKLNNEISMIRDNKSDSDFPGLKEINAAKEKANNAKDKVNTLNEGIAKNDENIKNHYELINKYDEELKGLKNRENSLHVEVSKGRAEIEKLTAEVKKMKEDLSSEKKSKIDINAPEYEIQKNKIESLETKYKQASESLKNKNDSVSKKMTEQFYLPSSIRKVEEQKKNSVNQIKNSSEMIELNKNTLKTANKNYELAVQNIETVKNELITNKEKEISRYEAQVKDRNKTFEANTQAIDTNTQKLKSNEDTLRTTNEQLIENRKQLVTAEAKWNEVKEDLKNTQNDISKIKADLQIKVPEPEKVELLKQNEAEIQANNLAAKEDAVKLEKELENLNADRDKKLGEIENLRTDSPDKIEEIEEATKEVEKLNEKISDKEEQLKKTKKEIEKGEKDEEDKKKKADDDKNKPPELAVKPHVRDTPFRRREKVAKKGEPVEKVAEMAPSIKGKTGEELLGELIAWLFMMLLALIGEGVNYQRRKQAAKDVLSMMPMLQDMAHLVDKKNALEKKIQNYKNKHPEPPERSPRQKEKIAKWEKKLQGYEAGLKQFQKHIEDVAKVKAKRNKEYGEKIDALKATIEKEKERIKTAETTVKDIEGNIEKLEEDRVLVMNKIAELNRTKGTYENLIEQGINLSDEEKLKLQNDLMKTHSDINNETTKLRDLNSDKDKQLQNLAVAKNDLELAQKELKQAKLSLEKTKNDLKAEERSDKLKGQMKEFEVLKAGIGTKNLEGGLGLEGGKAEPPPVPPPGPKPPEQLRNEGGPVPPEQNIPPLPPTPNTPENSVIPLTTPAGEQLGRPPLPQEPGPVEELNRDIDTINNNLANLENLLLTIPPTPNTTKLSGRISELKNEIELMSAIPQDMHTSSQEVQKQSYEKAKVYFMNVQNEIRNMEIAIREETTKKQAEKIRDIVHKEDSEKRDRLRQSAIPVQRPIPEGAQEKSTEDLYDIQKLEEELARIKERIKSIERKQEEYENVINTLGVDIDKDKSTASNLKISIKALTEKLKHDDEVERGSKMAPNEREKLENKLEKQRLSLSKIEKRIENNTRKINKAKLKTTALQQKKDECTETDKFLQEKIKLLTQIKDVQKDKSIGDVERKAVLQDLQAKLEKLEREGLPKPKQKLKENIIVLPPLKPSQQPKLEQKPEPKPKPPPPPPVLPNSKSTLDDICVNLEALTTDLTNLNAENTEVAQTNLAGSTNGGTSPEQMVFNEIDANNKNPHHSFTPTLVHNAEETRRKEEEARAKAQQPTAEKPEGEKVTNNKPSI